MLSATALCFAIASSLDLYAYLHGVDVQPYPFELVAFFLPLFATHLVGGAIVVRRSGHRVGWLFLALGIGLNITGPLDTYAYYGAYEREFDWPAADFIAVLSDITFVPWLAIIALILLNTPSGRVEGRRWQAVGWIAVGSAATAILAAITGPYRGDYRDSGIVNPLELTKSLVPLRMVAVAVLHVALVGSLASVVVRFRRSAGPTRKQLRWLALAGLPFMVLLFGAYFAAVTGQDSILLVLAGGFLSCFQWLRGSRSNATTSTMSTVCSVAG